MQAKKKQLLMMDTCPKPVPRQPVEKDFTANSVGMVPSEPVKVPMYAESSNTFQGFRAGDEVISAAIPSSTLISKSANARSFFKLRSLTKTTLKIDPNTATGADITEKFGVLFGPTLATTLIPAAYGVSWTMTAERTDLLKVELVRLSKKDSCAP